MYPIRKESTFKMGNFTKQISYRVSLCNSLISKRIFFKNSFKWDESNILWILFMDNKEIRGGGGRGEKPEKGKMF